MPRFSIGRGALNGAASGGARLVQAILGADKAYQDGYDRSALAQARLGQSEAAADKSEASAAQTGAETRILEGRPDVFNETLAARAGVPVPQVQAYRNYLNTGVMPERQLPGPPTEQGIGPGSVPLVDESAGGRIRALIGQLGLLQGNLKDVNPDQLANADSTYSNMALRDDVLAGRREAAPVAEAQRAAKGSDLFKQAGNGSVLDVTTGEVDQTNPIATATVGVKRAQANKAATGGGKGTAGPMDDTKKAQAAILFQELQETRARKQTAQGADVARAQADEAAVISELKALGIKDLGQITKLPKPAAGAKAGAAGQKVEDAQDVLALLKEAEPLLQTSTESYLGTLVDQGLRGVGLSTEGAQSAAKLKAIEGLLISKMPKMSGPQSDKDVMLYRQMAGQIGDPTMPAATRQAALETIRSINNRYVGANAAPAQRPRVTDDASYNALPSGTEFLDPSGQVRRKP